MEIRTGCPTGCKYISGDKCIASECPYQTGGVRYDIRMNKQGANGVRYVFYDDTLDFHLDGFVKWLRVKEKQQPHTLLLMSVDDISNAVEKYKIEKGVK